mmetsp:Transcript_5121/g.15158  ORF Transcript_5121/g.15158 Transcript_5121/m.15158 type:complete len:224 (+) Transcript_5121:610-1281(+)
MQSCHEWLTAVAARSVLWVQIWAFRDDGVGRRAGQKPLRHRIQHGRCRDSDTADTQSRWIRRRSGAQREAAIRCNECGGSPRLSAIAPLGGMRLGAACCVQWLHVRPSRPSSVSCSTASHAAFAAWIGELRGGDRGAARPSSGRPSRHGQLPIPAGDLSAPPPPGPTLRRPEPVGCHKRDANIAGPLPLSARRIKFIILLTFFWSPPIRRTGLIMANEVIPGK